MAAMMERIRGGNVHLKKASVGMLHYCHRQLYKVNFFNHFSQSFHQKQKIKMSCLKWHPSWLVTMIYIHSQCILRLCLAG